LHCQHCCPALFDSNNANELFSQNFHLPDPLKDKWHKIAAANWLLSMTCHARSPQNKSKQSIKIDSATIVKKRVKSNQKQKKVKKKFATIATKQTKHT